MTPNGRTTGAARDVGSTDADRAMKTYLDDHRAGAAAGLAMARRLADRYGHEPGFEGLPGLVREIAADRVQLEALHDRHGGGGHWRQALAVIGERLRRLKHLSARRSGRHLSRVEEIEELAAGVYVKERLWETLEVVGPRDDEIDLAELRRRAGGQLATLESLHRRAAVTLLTSDD